MENAKYVYPMSPGPPPNSPVCILLFYMTGQDLVNLFLVIPFRYM